MDDKQFVAFWVHTFIERIQREGLANLEASSSENYRETISRESRFNAYLVIRAFVFSVHGK